MYINIPNTPYNSDTNIHIINHINYVIMCTTKLDSRPPVTNYNCTSSIISDDQWKAGKTTFEI